ncbi:Hypothetical predicted protein [Pelobates cultripes]|uniref:Endonuclease/exonuclease/phosphatase domain-containing protein n=1 Tax=Pelobates cultripes TaxID=61616 RepID=A0AAD1WHG0_PELCU|nr:Hypothetical predicted protein [Pelobates cultripes]
MKEKIMLKARTYSTWLFRLVEVTIYQDLSLWTLDARWALKPVTSDQRDTVAMWFSFSMSVHRNNVTHTLKWSEDLLAFLQGLDLLGNSVRSRLLRFCSYNVHRRNVPEWSSRLVRELWASRISIVFFQETHYREDAHPVLSDSCFLLSYFSHSSMAKYAGVVILIAWDIPFILGEFQRIQQLEIFREGMLLVEGDLNARLPSLMDSSRGCYALFEALLTQIRAGWQSKDPKGRDFSFFLQVHSTYSHIDYAFVARE